MIRLLILLVVLSGCSHSGVPRTPAAETGTMPPQIIDAHVHLETVWTEGSLDEFTANRVAGVVYHAQRANPTPAKSPRTFPFRVKMCAGLSPVTTVKQVESALKDGRVGCIKIYLGYVKKWASDPFYRPFYQLAEKHKVVVVFHTGDTYEKDGQVKYADPLTIDEVAVAYPKVKFVIAHVGNPWFQSAAEVVYKNDNVYVDTSALMLDDVSTRDPDVVDQLMVKPLRWVFYYVENPKKFLFATDWPLAKIGPYVEAVKKAIPPEHWKAVFYQNAADLFGL